MEQLTKQIDYLKTQLEEYKKEILSNKTFWKKKLLEKFKRNVFEEKENADQTDEMCIHQGKNSGSHWY